MVESFVLQSQPLSVRPLRHVRPYLSPHNLAAQLFWRFIFFWSLATVFFFIILKQGLFNDVDAKTVLGL